MSHRPNQRRRRLLAGAAGLLLPPGLGALPKGPRMAGFDPRPGMLLVAGPYLDDQHFTRAVVLLIKHDADGSQGLMLNNPMAVPAIDVVPPLLGRVDRSQRLFFGGPVAEGSVRVLVQTASLPAPGIQVGEDVGLVHEERALTALLAREPLPPVRVLSGYTGWRPGQLMRELLRGDWYLSRAPAATWFALEPDRLWVELNRRFDARSAARNGRSDGDWTA